MTLIGATQLQSTKGSNLPPPQSGPVYNSSKITSHTFFFQSTIVGQTKLSISESQNSTMLIYFYQASGHVHVHCQSATAISNSPIHLKIHVKCEIRGPGLFHPQMLSCRSCSLGVKCSGRRPQSDRHTVIKGQYIWF